MVAEGISWGVVELNCKEQLASKEAKREGIRLEKYLTKRPCDRLDVEDERE